MTKEYWYETIKYWIGNIAYKVFLWAYNMTEAEYLAAVYEDAVREYKSEKANNWLMK